MRCFFLPAVICFLTGSLLAQEAEFPKNKLAVVIGHAHISEGQRDGEHTGLLLPSWGLDYDRRLSEKWSIGLHSDVILENFKIEIDEIVEERSSPLATALMVGFKPGKHLMMLAGGGGEFAKEEHFGLVRLGLDYGFELPEEWELGVSLMSDFKINAYNSWIFGVGVSKLF